MPLKRLTRPNSVGFPKYILFFLSCAIVLAVSVSAFKLAKICTLMTGEQLVGMTTAALFWVLGAATHFGTRALGQLCRVMAFILVYGLKVIPAVIYSVEAHAARIHYFMAQNSTIQIAVTSHSSTAAKALAESPSIEIADMIIFVVASHPSALITSIFVTFVFLVVGDLIAVALEILHSNMEQ